MSDDKHTTPVEYREIPRFVGYRFGDDGSVWTCWSQGHPVLTDEWRRLGGWLDKKGYHRVTLKDASLGKQVEHAAARLILEAFKGPCPVGMEARHLDNHPANNRIENLAWSTHVDNIADKRLHGTLPVGSRHPMAKLTEGQIPEIRARWAMGATGPELARIYGVHKATIAKAVNGRCWKHVAVIPTP